MIMAIPIGESIVIGSALFATMGVIIKCIAVRADSIMHSRKDNSGNNAKVGPGVTRKSLDQILDAKFKILVTDPVCLARHEGLERHVTDVFTHLTKMMDDMKVAQDKIFDKLDEIKKCQIKALQQVNNK